MTIFPRFVIVVCHCLFVCMLAFPGATFAAPDQLEEIRKQVADQQALVVELQKQLVEAVRLAEESRTEARQARQELADVQKRLASLEAPRGATAAEAPGGVPSGVPGSSLTGNAPRAGQEAAAQTKEAPGFPNWKLSGLMFGDYYYVASNHRESIEDQHGFWLRRIYFTYDHTWSKTLSMRFRLEMNSAGDLVSRTNLTPYVKDAYLRYSSNGQAVSFGIAPTPGIDSVETVWNYRSIEKTPLDLFRWDSTRDFGVLYQGSSGKEGRFRYSFQFGNGAGVSSERDKAKSVRGSFGYRTRGGFSVDAYADWQGRPGIADINTWQLSGAWQRPKYRLGALYAHQDRRPSVPGREWARLDLLSVFAVTAVHPRLNIVARVDRNFDPVPGGETIDYLPVSDLAKSTFYLFALDFGAAKPLRIQPNVEIVSYGHDPGGTRPAADVIPRLTLFFTW